MYRWTHVLLLGLVSLPAWAVPCRLLLADQSDWEGVRGFYLDFENDAPDGTPCRLASLNLILGVADGANWRYIFHTPAWQLNHDYSVKAVITPANAELWLDGVPAGQSAGGLALNSGQALAGFVVPDWADGPADYLIIQKNVTAAASSGQTVTIDFSQEAGRPVPLMLLAPGASQSAPWNPSAGDMLTLTASFRIVTQPDPRSVAPFLDRYGQSWYSTFPGKIQSDADLAAAATEETKRLDAWGTPSGYDAYGGIANAGWKDSATGFFHLARHNGVWWLFTPAGNPCFYIGLDTAPALNWDRTPITDREWEFAYLPPKTDPYSAAWGYDSWYTGDGAEDVAFHTVNMIRKYGAQWDTTATDLAVRRMKAWAFTGLGKWSSDAGNLPILPVLSRSDVPSLVNHPDIFDSSIQAQFRYALSGQVTSRKSDPLVVGWSLGNEIDEIVTTDETQQILKLGSGVAAKRALVDQALASLYKNDVARMAAAWGVSASSVSDLYAAVSAAPPAADVESLRQYYATSYYKFIFNTVKQLDPNHLYFGFWIVPGYWENESDWQLIAPYCDAIGYDFYNYTFTSDLVDRLFAETSKPVLLGEFSMPATYHSLRGFGIYGVYSLDDAGSGDFYLQWMRDAARNPYCVGVAWFQYRNEPVTGRGPGRGTALVYGENYAFGMVDVADRPKYDLVERVRAANLDAPLGRLALNGALPAVASAGVANAASFAASAPVAPGSLVSVFGVNLAVRQDHAAWLPLPQILAGASLQIGGVAAPLIFASASQLNAQIPWELAGKDQADLTVSNFAMNGNTVTIKLARVAPGIFSMDGSGTGQGAVVDAITGQVAEPAGGPWHGRPAARGSTVSIYCTGLGPVTNQPASGAPTPESPLARTTDQPQVTIGEAPATVAFSGLAPGEVGLYQVNVEVPGNAPTGSAVPLKLTISGVESNTVTIAVE